MKQLQEQIEERICDALDFVYQNPLVFVSETDIHSIIMSELFQIPELSYKTLYPTACTIGLNQHGEASSEKYKTMLAHKEYGHCDQNRARSDIVILNPDLIKNISDPLNLKEDKTKNSYLVPDFIIEIGTEKAAQTKDVFRSHLVNDLQKLRKSAIKGYLIHIQRNFVTQDKIEPNKFKYEEYLDVLNEETTKNTNSNIRVIVALINIGNNGRTIKKEGKVKLYIDNKFTGINKASIKEELTKLIKQVPYGLCQDKRHKPYNSLTFDS